MHKGQKEDRLVHRIDGGERLLDSGTELSGGKKNSKEHQAALGANLSRGL